MSMKSSNTHYGPTAVAIHWLSAGLVVAVLATGFISANSMDPDIKIQALSVHVPIAIVVVLLTLARLYWWKFVDRKPAPARGTPKWQRHSATAVHWLFHVVIFGMAASGIGMLLLSGAGSIIFGGAEGQLPDFWDFKPRLPHGFGARAMLLLLVAHVGAALYHQFVRRDGLLQRMWFGGT